MITVPANIAKVTAGPPFIMIKLPEFKDRKKEAITLSDLMQDQSIRVYFVGA